MLDPVPMGTATQADLKAGRVHDVIAGLEPHRERDPDVAASIDYLRKNQDRMQYDEYINRGILVRSGVVESLGARIAAGASSKREATGRRPVSTNSSP